MAHGSKKTPQAKLKRYHDEYKHGIWGIIVGSVVVLGLAAATLAKNKYGSHPVGILAWNIVVSIITPIIAFIIWSSTDNKLVIAAGIPQKADTPVLSYILLCVLIALWTSAFVPLGVIINNFDSSMSQYDSSSYRRWPSMPENIYEGFNQGGIGTACAIFGATVMFGTVVTLAALTLAMKNAKECLPIRNSQV